MFQATRVPRAGVVGRIVESHQLASFLLLAVGGSWAYWAAMSLSGANESIGILAVIPGAFGPPVAAIAVVWFSGGAVGAWLRSVAGLGVSRRWYAVALGLPVGMVALASLVFLVFDVDMVPGVLPVRFLIFLPTIVFMTLLGGGQEELGWRGFALPALERRLHPLVAALFLGGVWACWHLPLFYLPGASQFGQSFPFYAVGVVGLSVIFTWLHNRTASVAVVMLFHGSYNAAQLLYPVSVEALTSPALSDIVLTAVAVGTWSVALVVITTTRGNLGYQEPLSGAAGVDREPEDRDSQRAG